MAKKASSKKTGKTKKELLDEAIAEAVGAGKELHLESVDFSDPNRPKTCLEVDFPILPINHVAAIEGNAGKPIYQMSKWWARRRSSVFRSMLIAAATKAPDDPGEAAKLVWDSYYGNHQKNEAFKKLKVADIFMGGGTTIVEGARLGMQMLGNDLNPVAWFVVKNELAQVDTAEVQKLLDHIEAEVKPQIMPFYACDCPRGHKGKWTQRSTGKVMGKTFDPLALKPEERGDYEYEGPEVIYTFWAKHGPCQATGCGHRTPIMSSPVIAVKTLTVKAWIDRSCRKCHKDFDIEQHDARMAPAALFVSGPDENPYAVMDDTGSYSCPHCGHHHQDEAAKDNGESGSLGKAKNKSVDLTLLIHPDWLKGSPGKSKGDECFGGTTNDSADSTEQWLSERSRRLSLIEVRGAIPEQITLPTGHLLYTDARGGNAPAVISKTTGEWEPKKSVFECKAPTCGKVQDVLEAINESKSTAPASPYMIQGFCPYCKNDGQPYDGRFFSSDSVHLPLIATLHSWESNSEGLMAYAPVGEIQPGLETSVRTPLHKYNYRKWTDFFNARQLITHTSLFRALSLAPHFDSDTKLYVLAALQQYLRTQNMFCIWNLQADKLEPFFSKNNYQPPNRPIENGVFNKLGRGNWASCVESLFETAEWHKSPWELVSRRNLEATNKDLAIAIGDAKSSKVHPNDPVNGDVHLTCGSSTSLASDLKGTFDCVITDPPFGDIMQYAEFSAFFYAWLKPVMARMGFPYFDAEHVPTALEAVENVKRHGKDTPHFYSRLLKECWTEAGRLLKPGGILTFTFHHDKDGPWIAVLESLFNAGFYLEAAFPVRSDETKGEGSTPGTFGAQKVEYDVIHVCRKRVDETTEISWARLRRKILQDVQQLQDILQHHQQAGLGEGDLKVIRRGKALEHYSKHFGKVYVEKGRDFSVKEALTGINQLLDDQSDQAAEVPPVSAEPYTRQFLRLFADKSNLYRDQMQKFLRGTGVSPAEFEERGWCNEEKKVFHLTPPIEQARKWKGALRKGLGRDFDQAMFLIGACYENSGINVSETLNNPNFSPHPATGDIIDWFTRHGGDSQMKDAAKLAKQLYSKWVASNQPKIKAAQRTFDFANEEA